MRKVIRCRSCRRPLSAVLVRIVNESETNQTDGRPFLPQGSVHADGEFWPVTEGCYVIHLEDRRNLAPHADPRRLNGCCGLDGCDGPNQVCLCGAEVATEKSDCWMPHALVFLRDAVELVDG